MVDTDSKPGALARWSRRKAANVASDDADDDARRKTPAQQSSTQAADAPLTDEDMPPLDTLNEDSDFSGFLSPKVSEGLRKAALRKLFRSAGFNLRDGLDDYDDDFRDFTALGDLITSDMKHQMERAEERRRAQAEAEEGDAEKEDDSNARSEDADEHEADDDVSDSNADDRPAQDGALEK